ncbi:hypothetical protein [Syntrophobotulus glycolicus]|uniref:hypothetical protein n=1 Tax=Syntrophobotulus glycolicus TaxID=51197 RepID=UPI0011D1135C|nr:hypothetical protein [Syntrophobotulus glycolicus]
MGNIYSIALLQIQHPSAGFFIAYAVIVLLDIIRDVSESLLTFDFVTLEEYMFLMSNKVNLWHGLWLLLIFMLLYQLGLSISRGKDIYWGER